MRCVCIIVKQHNAQRAVSPTIENGVSKPTFADLDHVHEVVPTQTTNEGWRAVYPKRPCRFLFSDQCLFIDGRVARIVSAKSDKDTILHDGNVGAVERYRAPDRAPTCRSGAGQGSLFGRQSDRAGRFQPCTDSIMATTSFPSSATNTFMVSPSEPSSVDRSMRA